MKSRQIRVDNDLDKQLQPFVPQFFRAHKKCTLRVDFVLREWLRLKLESGSASGGLNGMQTQPSRTVNNSARPKRS